MNFARDNDFFSFRGCKLDIELLEGYNPPCKLIVDESEAKYVCI